MNEKEHPLEQVVKLLNELQPVPKGMYSLHIFHHELNCCLCRLAPKEAIKIARINSFDINNGLTVNLWSQIEAQIRIFHRKDLI